MKRILVTGSTGQVGWELARALLPLGEVLTPSRAQLDLSQPASLEAFVSAQRPDVVVNPAAYTAVDKAEAEPELAQRVNAEAPGELARACAKIGALFVHYSTDYVFDGRQRTAYRETDATGAQSVYGRSKLAGEQAVLAAGGHSLILRTSWVYAARGKNFLLTMLRLARERNELRVVSDQYGAPTWARVVADATAQAIAKIPAGEPPPVSLAHVACGGKASWHEFASMIVARGAEMGLCGRTAVTAIATSEYPTPARRPEFSTLNSHCFQDAFGLQLPHWEDALLRCMEDLRATV